MDIDGSKNSQVNAALADFSLTRTEEKQKVVLIFGEMKKCLSFSLKLIDDLFR